MPTLYKRVNYYCEINKTPHLNAQQRAELGKIVIDAFWAKKRPDWAVTHATYTNEQGTFRVVAYPRWFLPIVDQLIDDFYQVLYPPAPKRKRIPAKSTPIYSTKNYPNNG